MGALAWIELGAPVQGLLNVFLRGIFNLPSGYGPLNVYSMEGLIFVMGMYYSPYVYLFVSSSLQSLDPNLEHASRIMGASGVRTFFRITLPSVAPAILSAAMVVTTYSLSAFSIPTILGRPAGIEVVTTSIYYMVNESPVNPPLAAALGFYIVPITVAALFLYRKYAVTGKREFISITGRTGRTYVTSLGKWRYLVSSLSMTYVTIGVFLPLGALIFSSFVRYFTPNVTPDLFTFLHFHRLFSDKIFIPALTNSLILAVVGATVSILLAVFVSTMLIRKSSVGKLMDYILMIPMALPGVVFALGILSAWIRFPIVIYGTIWILLIAYVTSFLPLASRQISSALLQLDPSLQKSARVCGSSWFHTIRTITIPLIKTGIFSAWTLLFIIFMREISASMLLYSPKVKVASVVMFIYIDEAMLQQASALSLILLVITVLCLFFLKKVTGVTITTGMRAE